MTEDQSQVGHGGARPRAGRKPKRTKYQLTVVEAEDKIVDHLPEIVDNLIALANGGYERMEYEYQAAGAFTHQVKDEDGTVRTVLTFPDKKPDEMILIRKKKTFADKDRAANTYLVDRILGKPTQKQDIDLNAKGLANHCKARKPCCSE
jgi:hypothetical protein